MKTIRITKANRQAVVMKAVSLLKQGKVMIFPTETVYGIGADAFNEKAAAKIFKLKKRSKNQPLQILIADFEAVKKTASGVSAKALKLMKKSWPGPLTAVVRKKKSVPDVVTGGLNTVGLRMPDHLLVLEIIKALGRPVAASSANITGKNPPKTAKEAGRHFKSGISLVIDGGRCRIGKASKVVDATKRTVKVLRK
jgi:L-threonylcarbamoyladenylate synthase